MRVSEVMSRNVSSIAPATGLAEAAHKMVELDVGVLPLVDRGQLRGIAEGLHAGSPVTQVMIPEVVSCGEDDNVNDVIEEMGSDHQMWRMPVWSGSGELIGIVSIGDLARRDSDKDDVTETLRAICRPTGLHSQQLHTV